MRNSPRVLCRYDGSPYGTVDVGRNNLIYDSVRLLESGGGGGGGAWAAADGEAFRRWVAAMLEWWVGSTLGGKARAHSIA